MDFDKILERIGPFGKYQIVTYVLIGIAGFQAGMHNLASVFVNGLPETGCHVPALSNLNMSVQKTLVAPPKEYGGNSRAGSGITCEIYDMNYTSVYLNHVNNISYQIPNTTLMVPCRKWDYDDSIFEYTIVTRWDLVCSRGWLRAFSSSTYMLGFLIGSIGFGNLSDRLGRKTSFLLADAMLVVTGCVAAFIPNYWGHIIFRILAGVAAAGTFVVGFVLVMETMGKEYRMIPGIFYQGWFAIGYVLISGIAFLIRDYRYFYLSISIWPLLFLSYYWFVGESPRWLMARGRFEEARREVRRAAKMNGADFPQELMEEEATHLSSEDVTAGADRTYTIIDLLRTPNMKRRCLNICYNWFVNSMVFYGLSIGVSDLAGSPYLNLCISGLAEFPGYAIAVLTLDRLGRRWPLAFLMTASGVCCLLMVIVPPRLWIMTTVLAMLGKMFISGSFAVIYVFSAELFPTVVRNLGVGAGSMSARLGGLVAPFIAELGYLVWGPLPYIIFGVLSLLAGALTLLLPETLNQRMPETLEEGEEFGRKFEWFPNIKKPVHTGDGKTEKDTPTKDSHTFL